MRALIVLAALAGCTPDIVSGAYLCGPDSSCPEDLVCSGASGTCVLASQVEPFACTPKVQLEPDDTMAEAHPLDFGCVSAVTELQSCMLDGDVADWVTFVPPAVCNAVEVQARLSFPLAFQDLGFELWDVEANMQLASDAACTQGAGTSDVRRCLDFQLVPGKQYAIKVHPTGDGTCDGGCTYNRYTLTVQLATPG